MFTTMSSRFFRALIPLCAAALLCGCGAGAEEDTATAKALSEHQGEEQLDGSGSGDGECYGCEWMNMCTGCSLAQNEEIEATAVMNALGSLPLAGVEASGAVRGIVVHSATQGTTARMALSNAEQELAFQVDKLLDVAEKFLVFVKETSSSVIIGRRDQIAEIVEKVVSDVRTFRFSLENGECGQGMAGCQAAYLRFRRAVVETVGVFLNPNYLPPGDIEGRALQEQLRKLLTECARRAAQQIVAHDSATMGGGVVATDGALSLTRLAAAAAGKPASASPNQGTGRLVAPQLWPTVATQRGASTVNVITQREEAASPSSPLIQVDIQPDGQCGEATHCFFTADAHFACGSDMFCKGGIARAAQCKPAPKGEACVYANSSGRAFLLQKDASQCKLWCGYAGQDDEDGVTVTVTRGALQNMEENRAVVEPVPLVGPGNLVVNPVVNPVNPPVVNPVTHQYFLEVAFEEPGFDNEPTWFKGILDVDQDGNLLRVGGEIMTPYLEQNCATSCPVQRHEILLGAQAAEMESVPFVRNLGPGQAVATPGKLWTVYLDAANSPVHGKPRSPDPRANPTEPNAPDASDDGNAWLRFFLPNPEFLKNGRLSWSQSGGDAENGLPSYKGVAYADCSLLARRNDNCVAGWHEHVEGVRSDTGGLPVCWRLTAPGGERFTSGTCPGN